MAPTVPPAARLPQPSTNERSSTQLRDEMSHLDERSSIDKMYSMVDKDASGTIDRAEFSRLHRLMKAQVTEEHRQIKEAELAAARSAQRLRAMSAMVLVMALFLALSTAATGATTFYLLEATREVHTLSGALTDRNDAVVSTGAARFALSGAELFSATDEQIFSLDHCYFVRETRTEVHTWVRSRFSVKAERLYRINATNEDEKDLLMVQELGTETGAFFSRNRTTGAVATSFAMGNTAMAMDFGPEDNSKMRLAAFMQQINGGWNPVNAGVQPSARRQLSDGNWWDRTCTVASLLSGHPIGAGIDLVCTFMAFKDKMQPKINYQYMTRRELTNRQLTEAEEIDAILGDNLQIGNNLTVHMDHILDSWCTGELHTRVTSTTQP